MIHKEFQTADCIEVTLQVQVQVAFWAAFSISIFDLRKIFKLVVFCIILEISLHFIGSYHNKDVSKGFSSGISVNFRTGV